MTQEFDLFGESTSLAPVEAVKAPERAVPQVAPATPAPVKKVALPVNSEFFGVYVPGKHGAWRVIVTSRCDFISLAKGVCSDLAGAKVVTSKTLAGLPPKMETFGANARDFEEVIAASTEAVAA